MQDTFIYNEAVTRTDIQFIYPSPTTNLSKFLPASDVDLASELLKKACKTKIYFFIDFVQMIGCYCFVLPDNHIALLLGKTSKDIATLEFISGCFFKELYGFGVDCISVTHRLASPKPITLDTAHKFAQAVQKNGFAFVLRHLSFFKDADLTALLSTFFALGLLVNQYLALEMPPTQIASQFNQHLDDLIEHAYFSHEINQLLSSFKLAPSSTQLTHNLVTDKVIDIIHTHIYDSLTVHEIALKLGYSTSYLDRCFKLTYEITIKQYILSEKIKVAQKMLQQSSVIEVTNQLAFSSQSHFTSVFRRFVGMTPKEYQRNLRAHP